MTTETLPRDGTVGISFAVTSQNMPGTPDEKTSLPLEKSPSSADDRPGPKHQCLASHLYGNGCADKMDTRHHLVCLFVCLLPADDMWKLAQLNSGASCAVHSTLSCFRCILVRQATPSSCIYNSDGLNPGGYGQHVCFPQRYP